MRRHQDKVLSSDTVAKERIAAHKTDDLPAQPSPVLNIALFLPISDLVQREDRDFGTPTCKHGDYFRTCARTLTGSGRSYRRSRRIHTRRPRRLARLGQDTALAPDDRGAPRPVVRLRPADGEVVGHRADGAVGQERRHPLLDGGRLVLGDCAVGIVAV